MAKRSSPWPAGVPCWTDLMTPDPRSAQAFYSAVCGWSFQETGDEYGGYSIATVGEAAAAGIGPSPGGPVAWTPYFASEDAEVTATAVTSAGGRVLHGPLDVGPLGRMFVASDPTGAIFGVWQAGSHIGAAIVNEPGGLTWEDLRTGDPVSARSFYGSVFGFRFDPLDLGGPDYGTFSRPDEEFPLGGMGEMMGSPGPPRWLVYFAVVSTDAAVSATETEGGRVASPARDTPYGRMATLADPQGAEFCVIETGDGPQPDRAG